jgi:hypothetical protein
LRYISHAIMAAPPPHGFDVFLSYAHEDEPRVSEVQHALEAQGIQVWRDRGQMVAGDAWIKTLETGLRQSRCVLLFYSQHAAASEWVQKEWNVALAVHIPIIPVRLDDSELPLMLTPIQHVDLTAAHRLSSALTEIRDAIRGGFQSPAPPPHIANPSVLGPDVAILQRLIVREAAAAAKLDTARSVAAAVGVVGSVAVVGFIGSIGVVWTGALATAPLIASGAIAWAITAQANSNRSEVMRLSTLKDGIELYCPGQPACSDFRMKLEAILRRRAGIGGVT